LKFNSYPVSLPIFSFLSLAVYPVGVTTYWCYFLQIIVYSFVAIAGYQVVPLSRLSVYQISRQLDNLFVFYDNFHTLTKRTKKKETQPIFKGSYLGNIWHNLVKILNVRWWRWPAFPLQNNLVSQICVYMKIALLFFL